MTLPANRPYDLLCMGRSSIDLYAHEVGRPITEVRSFDAYRDNCADLGLTIDHVRRAPVADSRLIFLTGTGLSEEPSRTATILAAERARAARTTVLVDLDYRSGLWPDPDTFGVHVRGLTALADLAIGTEEELQAATGARDAERGVGRLFTGTLGLFVLKRGAAGCSVFQRSGARADVPPFQIEVLNVLGAGDAFASGFIYGHLSGWPVDKAARFANAVGTIVVTRHGCANFMPTLDEVHQFMSNEGESAEAYSR